MPLVLLGTGPAMHYKSL